MKLQHQVVHVRADAQDHLAQDVQELRGLGVDRGVARRAGREEQRLVAFLRGRTSPRTGPAAYWRASTSESCRSAAPGPCPIAQMIESTLPFDDAAWIRLQRELGLVAGLHFRELVLAEERDDLAVGFDERHHGIERQSRDERAGTELQVDHVALARRDGRRLVEQPARIRELRADLRDLRVRAVDLGAELLLDLARPTRVPAPPLACAAACWLRADSRCPFELGEIGLRLLEIEARAGARISRARGSARRACARARALRRPRRCARRPARSWRALPSPWRWLRSATPRSRAARPARARAAPRGSRRRAGTASGRS